MNKRFSKIGNILLLTASIIGMAIGSKIIYDSICYAKEELDQGRTEQIANNLNMTPEELTDALSEWQKSIKENPNSAEIILPELPIKTPPAKIESPKN